MKYTLFFCLMTGLFTSALGQSTWRKGMVTTKDGTVMTGEINDKEWTVNPKEIEFREVGGATKTFTVQQIKNFSTDRPAKYESFAFEYDAEDQNVNSLSTNRTPLVLSRDTLFLKVIVGAKVGLFLLVDSNGRNHFFTNVDNGGIEELLNRKYRDAANSSVVGVNEKFKQQLLLKSGNCKELEPSIKQLKYNEVVLRNMVSKINKCKGYQVEPVWEGTVLTKPASAGFVLQFFFSNPEYTFLISDFSKINFGGGIFYEIYSKKKPNRISYYNELLFKQVNQDGLTFSNLPAEIQFSQVKMINSIRFSYPEQSGGRFYWGVGIGTGVRFNTLVNGKESIPGYPVYSGSEFELGVMVSGGKSFVISKSLKINTELRYELEQSPLGPSSFVGAHNLGFSVGLALR